MQKLVITYDAGDGFECSYTDHVPILYESAEAAIVDLELAIIKYLESDSQFECPFGKFGLDPSAFVYSIPSDYVSTRRRLNLPVFKKKDWYYGYELPEIRTLEEWFENEA